ncbi:hypothetical protein CP532_0939 [Ophiocordyceps camponoti-leonardi (nom. inval.)]|nr:hypothetical protein CP532_0939 [Ophiocordyceps camponoti-leonardi (nom. inval.)]
MSSGGPKTMSSRSSGPYDGTFHQHLIDHGIYPNRYRYPDGRRLPPPANLEDIRSALRRPLPASLQPSEELFDEFQQATADATKECHVMMDVMPLIEGNPSSRALPEVVTTLVDSWSLEGNFGSFCEGIAACRNGRDWAKRQRDLAIAYANKTVAAREQPPTRWEERWVVAQP